MRCSALAARLKEYFLAPLRLGRHEVNKAIISAWMRDEIIAHEASPHPGKSPGSGSADFV
jgi:hypothetical protein